MARPQAMIVYESPIPSNPLINDQIANILECSQRAYRTLTKEEAKLMLGWGWILVIGVGSD